MMDKTVDQKLFEIPHRLSIASKTMTLFTNMSLLATNDDNLYPFLAMHIIIIVPK